MTCTCQGVTGFGSAFPAKGTLRCLVWGNWIESPPGSSPLPGARACFLSDGTQWQAYAGIAEPWRGLSTVNISPAAYGKLFKNFTNPYSLNWRRGSLQGNDLIAQQVGLTLDLLGIKYGSGTVAYNGPAQYAASMNSLTGMAWGLQRGYLIIPPAAVARIQSDDAATGVIPESFWNYVGKPLAVMGTVIGGAALLGSAGAAGTTAASTPGSLAPTAINLPGASVASLSPVATGTVSLGGPLSFLPALTAPVSAGAGVLSLANTAAGVGSDVLKGATALTALRGLPSGGAPPVSPVTGAPQQTARSSSLVPLLLIGGVGAGLLFALHLI